MKNIKMLKYLLGFLIFTSCFFTGCSQQIQTNTPVKTLPLNLQTVTPSAKGTMSTQTLAPRPSLTSTITQTRFPTITPTTLIPLGADQYNEMLQKFLSEGGNCSFPCILGITPGKTTFNEARDIFRWMGNPLSQEKYPDGDAFFSTSLGYQEKDLSITIRLMEDNDIIENMYVGITLPWYKKDTDPHVWQTFLADTILEKYGPPSQGV